MVCFWICYCTVLFTSFGIWLGMCWLLLGDSGVWVVLWFGFGLIVCFCCWVMIVCCLRFTCSLMCLGWCLLCGFGLFSCLVAACLLC